MLQDLPLRWWARQSGGAGAFDWAEPWHTVLDEPEAPLARFVGGVERPAQALDRHVDAGAGGDRVKFHWRGGRGVRDVTYAELRRHQGRLSANVLKEVAAIAPGDLVVGIYLLMIPEVAVAMLGGCARVMALRTTSLSAGSHPRPSRERM